MFRETYRLREMNIRKAAVIVLALATVAAMWLTSLGGSPGHNKFWMTLELLTFFTATGLIFASASTLGARLWGLTIAIAAGLLLAILTIPGLRAQRTELIAPLLLGRERGFVVAALGRPDLLSGDIAISETYGYESTMRSGQLLVVEFRTTEHLDDEISASRWMEASAARAAHGLHPPP